MFELLLATARGTLQLCAGLFGGWLLFFAVGSRLDFAPPVGMNYLAWPIAFPLLAALPLAAMVALLLRVAGPPYQAALRRPRFRWGVLLPVGLIAFAVMLLTCPLETGGTLLDRLLGATG
jgi:hypothetical protein